MEARRYIVSGLVQGVGFRYFAFRRAHERGVVGYVRNLPDGRVEILAEGSPDALEALEKDLAVGPGPARVSRLEGSEVPATGKFTAFSITR